VRLSPRLAFGVGWRGASSLPALKRNDISREKIDLVLITHFHGDHFGGLPFLMLDAQFTRRTRPLVIAGPQGIERRLEQVMEALFENSSKRERRFDLRIVELNPEAPARFGAVGVMPFPVVHGDSGGPFLGYRIEVEGRIIFAAIFTTKLLGATRSDSIISRFIAPEIT